MQESCVITIIIYKYKLILTKKKEEIAESTILYHNFFLYKGLVYFSFENKSLNRSKPFLIDDTERSTIIIILDHIDRVHGTQIAQWGLTEYHGNVFSHHGFHLLMVEG